MNTLAKFNSPTPGQSTHAACTCHYHHDYTAHGGIFATLLISTAPHTRRTHRLRERAARSVGGCAADPPSAFPHVTQPHLPNGRR